MLSISGNRYDIGLAVFDKDGTLIDYALMWNQLAKSATASVVNEVSTRGEFEASRLNSLRDDILRAIGVDPVSWKSDPDGPLAVGPNALVYDNAAAVLTQAGISDSIKLIHEHFAPAFTAHPPEQMVRAVGDIAALFESLRAAGIPVIVATADYRDTTMATMRSLGVAHLVADYVCADDTHHPVKHDPESLLYQGKRFDISADRIMMVGDTIGDLRMAKEADIGLGLGVLTGAADREALTPWSDLVVNSIDDIAVLAT